MGDVSKFRIRSKLESAPPEGILTCCSECRIDRFHDVAVIDWMDSKLSRSDGARYPTYIKDDGE